MRHKSKGRKLGRNPSHRRAMLRNLASSLFLSERNEEINEAGVEYEVFETAAFGKNVPKAKGRVITTLQKAKQVRPLVEKCVTIARKGLEAEQQAEQFSTSAKRGSPEWKQWRSSDNWRQWAEARAPSVVARRRIVQLIRNKIAMEVLFDEIAPRFSDRDGGYTRIVRLAKPRLGDAGQRALLEFVGTHDRVSEKAEKPAFADDATIDEQPADAQGETAEATSQTDAGAQDELAEEKEE